MNLFVCDHVSKWRRVSSSTNTVLLRHMMALAVFPGIARIGT